MKSAATTRIRRLKRGGGGRLSRKHTGMTLLASRASSRIEIPGPVGFGRSDATGKAPARALPPDDRMYRALVERDSEFEGVFVVGVKTTGIFCRPTCGAKKPKRENVEFFADTGGAMFAGYRACKKCTPLDAARARPELVRSLVKLVERRKPERVGDAELRTLGVDPGTARRAFLKHFGMTFQAYQRAQRMGEAFVELRKDGRRPEKTTMIKAERAKTTAGYESESGFRAAFARVFGITPGGASEKSRMVSKWLDTPLGPMVAVASEEGLCLLEFCDRRALEREIGDIRRKFDGAVVPGTNEHIESIERELKDYFAGKTLEFRTKVVIAGSPFQEKVWRALCEIPVGETRSYGQLAKRVGSPGGSRAIGKANGDNRLAIIVPCHRVIRGDGSVCGYGGGVWRKEWLLRHEGVGGSLFGREG